MTPEELNEIKARCEAATSGPWEVIDAPIGMIGAMAIAWTGNAIYVGTTWKPGGGILSNADFIAHACTDIPALLAEVEQLTAENARLREALEEIVDYNNPEFGHLPIYGAATLMMDIARKALEEDKK